MHSEELKIENSKRKRNITAFSFCIVTFIFAFFIFTLDVEAATIGRPSNNLGLVGYWDFNVGKGGGTAYDRSGNRNDGVLTNMDTSTDWVDGKIGQALDFDGSDDYVEIFDDSTNDLNSTWTVSFWINPVYKGSTGSYGVILSKGDGANGSMNGFRFDQNQSTFFVTSDNQNRASYDLANVIASGSWGYVTVTMDGSALYIFVNGEQKAVGSIDSDFMNKAANMRLGAPEFGFHDSGNVSFQGHIDDVRTYDRALSAGEVQRLYKLGESKGQTIASTKTVVTDGLIGHWTFDGDVTNTNTTKDVSGNGNDGTLTNGPTPTIGKLGQALDFDGSDDYVDLGDNEDFNFGTDGSVTVAAWVQLDGVQQDSFGGNTLASITSKGTLSGTNPGFGIYARNESSAFQIRDIDENVVDISDEDGSTNINDGQWHHVVGVLDRSVEEIRLYTDGVSEGTESSSLVGSLDNADQKARIGNRLSSDTRYHFNGRIDDVRIYDRALSEDEIQRIYNAGASEKINTSFKNRLTDGLVGHWTFDGDVTNTNTTKDVSGNGNDGTLTNGPTPTIGKLGQALEFDGVDDYVLIDSSSSLTSSQNTITVAGWFYRSTPMDSEIALNKEGKWRILAGDCNTTKISLRTNPSWSGGCFVGNSSVPTGEWFHVVMVMSEDDTLSLYFNGSLDKSGPRAFEDADVEIAIGSYTSNFSYAWDGLIDDVRIYDRALSAGEVYELYNMGR